MRQPLFYCKGAAARSRTNYRLKNKTNFLLTYEFFGCIVMTVVFYYHNFKRRKQEIMYGKTEARPWQRSETQTD